MPPLPSRKTLESMKRVDLQRICKDYGVRANLKSEALIDLLLETQSAPTPQPTRRSVSTRQVSRAGPSRVSSMIVHDTEDEEQNDNDTQTEGVNEDTPPTPQPSLIPPPRTRKAKELQIRLGVGKPQAAGGQGPRAATRSSGSSRSRGIKASRSLKPKEATIVEEPETLSLPSSKQAIEPMIQPAPSPLQIPQAPPVTDSCDSESLTIKKLISEAMRPLEDQIHSLKSKLDEVQTIKADIATLRNQVVEISKTQKEHEKEFQSLRELSAAVMLLREEMNQLKEGLASSQSPIQPSTPKVRSTQLQQAPIGYGHPSTVRPQQGTSTNNNPLVNPGFGESTLGKRHRDSITSNATSAAEEGQEEGDSDSTTSKVTRPIKKKPRLEKTGSEQSSRQASTNPTEEDKGEDGGANDDMHRFTVFRGSDEPTDYVDPPPPTNPLPSFFEPPAGSSTNVARTRHGVPTSSANASENQPQTFGFSFLPISSTPQNPAYTQLFSYPEPPQSPSPAGSSLATFAGRIDDQRNDIFKPFGFPSPIRSARNYSALTQDDRGVNPAALGQGSSTKQREISNNDARAVSSTDSTTSTAEPPISKRTMYGTELEGDTRFGDFGVDGMATDYWANGNF